MALVPFVTAVNIGDSDGFDSRLASIPSASIRCSSDNFSDRAVNRLDLFEQHADVELEGLRRGARPRTTTTTRCRTNAATRWVPYLWPDEPDNAAIGNSYLRRQRHGSDDATACATSTKYTVEPWHATQHDERRARTPPARGPVVPLTNDTG